MNRYELIRGFPDHDSAQGYADRLPQDARARVAPYRTGKGERDFAFAVTVLRTYTGGRI